MNNWDMIIDWFLSYGGLVPLIGNKIDMVVALCCFLMKWDVISVLVLEIYVYLIKKKVICNRFFIMIFLNYFVC